MESINDAVAYNLKRLREQRKLSLDALAGLTGVSKSMLAQIERGDANPTITTVWKIANGLKLPFTELVTRPEKDYETVAVMDTPALLEDEGRFRNYPVFPYDDIKKFEIYYIEIDPAGCLQSAAHPGGAQEFITLFSGKLEICVGGEAFAATPRCAVRFKADIPHSYRNVGEEVCRLHMVIYYAKS